MRYLVLSDLHSNKEALDAVLDDARGEYDLIVCCGDLAGYAADPNPVLDWARANLHAVIRGNHDRGCAGTEDLEWFNPTARAAALWTMAQLTEVNFNYLRSLPRGPLGVDDFQLIHGSPVDEDEYLVSVADARNVFPYLETEIAFFGHTHLQGGYGWLNGQYHVIGRMEFFRTGCASGFIPADNGSSIPVRSASRVMETAARPTLFSIPNRATSFIAA